MLDNAKYISYDSEHKEVTVDKYKTIEQVRADNGLTQIAFAQILGTTFRTYQARLQGTQPKWTLDEVIKASQFNGGYIIIPTPTGSYKVKVEKVGE